MAYPEDRDYVIFTLRDGMHLFGRHPDDGPHDVLFTYEISARTGPAVLPRNRSREPIAGAEVLDERRIRFTFVNPEAPIRGRIDTAGGAAGLLRGQVRGRRLRASTRIAGWSR